MQSETAVIKCAQCGAQLIVPDCSEYVDEYRVRHIWKCEPCGYAFEATIASRRRESNCENHAPGSAFSPKAETRQHRLAVR
jgi:transcription elongation factor Elf1